MKKYEKTEKEKGFFLTSLENFWYYYKWPFLGGIAIFFIVIIALLTFSDTEEPSDAMVLSVFARPLTTQEYEFQSRLEDVIDDIDDNGTKHILTESLYVTEGGKSDNDAFDIGKFEGKIAYAQGDLVLLDGTNFDRFSSKDFLAPLEDYVDISQFDKEDLKFRDGKAVAVRLRDSKVLKDMQFIIDNVYAGIMFIPDENAEHMVPRRENAAKMLSELTKQ